MTSAKKTTAKRWGWMNWSKRLRTRFRNESMTDKKAKYQEVAYYPGCALEGGGHAYNRSTKALGKSLGLKLKEVDNWNCCGAMEVKNIDPKIQT